jgi:Aminoglycoside-2''-adenylyltransferase
VADGQIPPGGTKVSDPTWQAWSPADITRLLAGVRVPWYVAGGWAIDLFCGHQTREHGDLEIAVPAPDLGAIRDALAGYEFEVIGAGLAWPLDSPAFDVMHQTWVREPGGGAYRLDVFREPQRDGAWACRRDETIMLPYEKIIRRTESGIPYLAPQIGLLFKAKWAAEPKNQADLETALPLLDGDCVVWLRWALRRVHPGHRWIGVLGDPRAEPTRATDTA